MASSHSSARRLRADPVIPDDPAFPQQWALYNVGQEVEGEPGLPGADIRAADERHAHAFANSTRPVCSFEQSPEVFIDATDGGHDMLRDFHTTHVFCKIHSRFDLGDSIGQSLGHCVELARQRAREL